MVNTYRVAVWIEVEADDYHGAVAQVASHADYLDSHPDIIASYLMGENGSPIVDLDVYQESAEELGADVIDIYA